MSVGRVLDRVRRPEYTGENRCVPCTVVNLLIGGVVAAALALVWLPAGLLAGVLAAAAIYFRGYLVPGTPTATKRYFPERVLAWFDKAEAEAEGAGGGPAADVAVETTLRDLDAIQECSDRDDLCLTAEFREDWWDAIEDCRDVEAAREEAATLTRTDPGDIEFSEYHESGPFLANHDEEILATWASRAAFVADAAAVRVLEDRDPDWTHRSDEERNAVLNSLRLFLERCPSCGGPVELGEETVESCCRDIQVAAAECADCDSRVFEAETDRV